MKGYDWNLVQNFNNLAINDCEQHAQDENQTVGRLSRYIGMERTHNTSAKTIIYVKASILHQYHLITIAIKTIPMVCIHAMHLPHDKIKSPWHCYADTSHCGLATWSHTELHPNIQGLQK